MLYYKDMIDTDFGNNIRHISPHLGILLIGCIALGFVFLIRNAMSNLSETLTTTTTTPEGIEGVLSLASRNNPRYSDSVTYKSNVSGKLPSNANVYITTVCFQGEDMVFQKSIQQKGSLYLQDESLSGFRWDGEDASCSATLMYRTEESDIVYVVDSITYEVQGIES
jgi:hypothetical protein